MANTSSFEDLPDAGIEGINRKLASTLEFGNESVYGDFSQTLGEHLDIYSQDFPIFNGSNPRMWIKQCNNFFEFFPKISDVKRIDLAIWNFEGKAFSWILELPIDDVLAISWTQFCEVVCTRFERLIDKSKLDDKGPAKMETDELPADPAPSSATDENMQDSKAEVPAAENGVPESGDKPVLMETDAKVEAPKKKVTKKTVPVSEVVYGALASSDLQKTLEKEFEMALQDRVMEETIDKKNAVEAYVYDMRNKLHDKYHDFVIESEREQFITKLQEVEDWLYEDGEDETKGVYVAKLEELENVLRSWDPGDSIDCIEEVHIFVLEDQISRMQTANHLLLIQDYTNSFPSALCMMGYMEAIRRLLHGSGGIAKLLMIDASVDMEIVSLVISCLGLHWTNELEEIVFVSAGVMITRGDLGVEIKSKKMEAPVLFKGIGPSISPASNLVLKVLSPSAAAYSSNLKSKLSVSHTLTGSGISVVAVVQARNNARLLISGSLIMFGEFFRSGVQKAGSTTTHEKCGNEQFFSELSKWVFHERGHHKVGEAYEPSMHRIKDDMDYSVEVYEWSGTSWEPYVADDMQVQFYMMSPYVLQTLTTGNLAKPISSCACRMELKSRDPRGRGSSSRGGSVMAYVGMNYGADGVKKERSMLVGTRVDLVKNLDDGFKHICRKFVSSDPRGRGSYQPRGIVMSGDYEDLEGLIVEYELGAKIAGDDKERNLGC